MWPQRASGKAHEPLNPKPARAETTIAPLGSPPLLLLLLDAEGAPSQILKLHDVALPQVRQLCELRGKGHHDAVTCPTDLPLESREHTCKARSSTGGLRFTPEQGHCESNLQGFPAAAPRSVHQRLCARLEEMESCRSLSELCSDARQRYCDSPRERCACGTSLPRPDGGGSWSRRGPVF